MNSTTKIIAGVAVLALLFAGIGFAATTYKATTVSENNNIGVACLTLNDGVTASEAKLLGDGSSIIFDTTTTYNADTEASEIAYTPTANLEPGKILITNEGTATATVTLTITSDKALGLDMLFGEDTVEVGADGATWTIEGISLDAGAPVEKVVTFELPDVVDAVLLEKLTSGPFEFTIVASAEA